MSNDYTANPIYLDTFTSAIDVGDSVFANSDAQFCVEKIRWINGSDGNTALISDSDDNIIFKDTVSSDDLPVESDFDGRWFKGIHIAASGVAGGEILIYLK